MNLFDFFSTHIENLKCFSSSSQASGRCCFHEDRAASFSVNISTGLWTCHACQIHGNPKTFARRLGIPSPDASLEARSSVTVAPQTGRGGHQSVSQIIRASDSPDAQSVYVSGATEKRTVVARYVYTDETGQPLFRVCRTRPKGFFQQRWENEQWVSGLGNCRRVIYHLPEVLRSTQTIFFVEGEKDVERLRSLSLVATTSPMGANSWDPSFVGWFNQKRVAVIPDNDAPGKSHAEKVARDLSQAGAQVKLVSLPGLSDKQDVSDFLDGNGNNVKELLSLVRAAKPFGTPRKLENAYDYFAARGLALPPANSLLPTEYSKKAREAYDEITGTLERLSDQGYELMGRIETLWGRVKSSRAYDQWVSLLRDLHASCQ